ncbi:MAG: hypothetical protein GTO14_12970 [Anaerolineales bacterium]|nr:hypothetical protein [Anaerolineales bacterium]
MKPARRFREPFLPIHQPPLTERFITSVERWIKGILFNCSMCGNCILQETAFICPMLCPKGLRNGPCGSGSSISCCVDPSRPCIWHHIYARSDELDRLDRLLEVQAPLDWNRVGRGTWGGIISEARARGLLSLTGVPGWTGWREHINRLFEDIRQPDWWQGDDRFHPPAFSLPMSSLQSALNYGEFVVTAEVSPPAGSSPSAIRRKADRLRGLVHAANVTQNPMATPRMSSLACSLLLARSGVEPILQLTARDYNRLALQSEALGASSLAVNNILCLTGDPPTAGRGPAGELPFDLDATQMLWILRRMRDEGRFLDGRKLTHSPRFFLGAAGSPYDANLEHEALRLEKKINAGAQFIQSQLVYDVDPLERWLEVLDNRGLLDKVHILIGIGPLRSAKMVRYMQEHIPDITIPANVAKQLENSANSEETGLKLAQELIEKVRQRSDVSGIHMMSMGWEEILPRLLQELGLNQET